MAKASVRTRYVCTACGAVSPQWAGQCPECGEWNTLEAQRQSTAPAGTRGSTTVSAQYAGDAGIRSLADIPRDRETRFPRGLVNSTVCLAAAWSPAA